MYRGTFAIVDAAAIRDNVARLKTCLGSQTRLLVAVKANGYGHGAAVAARAAVAGGATDLGVASLEEAIELREAGITTPILILGPIPTTAFPVAAEQRVAVTITDFPSLDKIPLYSPVLQLHIKVDTGMTRLGLRRPEDVVQLARWIEQQPGLTWAGVFTHLACADEASLAHSEAQIQRFQAVLDALREAGLHPPVVHAANSAAAVRRPDWHFDMVRVGISAYGYPASDEYILPFALDPAMHVYSFITRVAEIGPGETVGYGATFTAQRPTRVATVPIGYADGYHRVLSNRGYALVHGQKAPVIGNVCMDQLMLDVTDVPGVSVGDCVTLFGRSAPPSWSADLLNASPKECEARIQQGFAEAKEARLPVLSAADLARYAGTISYELLCAVSPRVPRLHIGLDEIE
ncbi:alanine racemase [Alicyclobacillus herbarius]|uniref:alanine racemase n=1 Tax=Alicyclobacillus herbarius TaxID=122960 RepID=UPI00041AEE77|nr:alanine racemase [Alicyclobacillus herbarius]